MYWGNYCLIILQFILMYKISNKEVLKALRNSDTKIIDDYFYNNCYPNIEYLVVSNNGTINDAKDIFQDALIILIDIVNNKKDYQISCTIKTLFISIARNLWLRRIKKEKKFYKDSNVDIYDAAVFYEPDVYIDSGNNIESMIDEFGGINEKDLFNIAKQISDDCYSILVSTDSVNRKKKYQYKQKIKKILKKELEKKAT